LHPYWGERGRPLLFSLRAKARFLRKKEVHTFVLAYGERRGGKGEGALSLAFLLDLSTTTLIEGGSGGCTIREALATLRENGKRKPSLSQNRIYTS